VTTVTAATENYHVLKYTIDRMGVDVFKAEVEKRSGISFSLQRKLCSHTAMMNMAGFKKSRSLWYYTAFIENGRVLDDENVQFKTAFLEIAKSRKATFCFTLIKTLL